jgi:hypothetical protein
MVPSAFFSNAKLKSTYSLRPSLCTERVVSTPPAYFVTPLPSHALLRSVLYQ